MSEYSNEWINPVYVTKYALTRGIIKTDGQDMGHGVIRLSGKHGIYIDSKDWHNDIDSAKEKAKEMRLKKLSSLRKQFNKINDIDFDKESKFHEIW